jgi:hypothetical protein
VKIDFPSREFDEAVAAVCHGLGSDEQMRALNELLRANAAARDEYLFRTELHARLASEPDIFMSMESRVAESSGTSQDAGESSPSPLNGERAGVRGGRLATPPSRSGALGGITPHPQSLSPLRGEGGRRAGLRWAVALAACVALMATGWWALRLTHSGERKGTTSKAVAMLSRVVDAEWNDAPPRLGAPLEPGALRLKSGLAQIVFYSGARVVIEGPAELQLISPGEVVCSSGRLIAEVPPQAKGFRVNTPQMNVTDLGTVFGVEVKDHLTELHVFKGSVEFQSATGPAKQSLLEGKGAVADGTGAPRLVPANPTGFASLFDLQNKSSEAEVLRHEQWRAASSRLDEDPSLLVHFDFEQAELADWRLHNTSKRIDAVPDATIVGGQWVEGRWPGKSALEFRGVSDRVRLSVPGDYESLTLAAWVRVQGLDRRVNSLFMSDAFEPGTLHWLILNDGAPTVTVVGPPGSPLQIVTAPPVVTLDKFGMWQHVAVVVDNDNGQVVHYLNGRAISETPLKIKPPFRVGTAELGNWNAKEFKGDESLMIRNFSGAMDEFCLFSRALSAEEIHALYSQGKPQPEPVASRK